VTDAAILAPASSELELTTSDGLRLAASLDMTAEAPRAMAVVAHGFTGTRHHPEVVAVVRTLLAAGVGVLSFDARGHGDSEGLCTLGDAEAKDVAAAVAVARDIHPRVVTVGASMGAIAVLRHAASDRDVNGTVVVSCPAQWRLHSPQSALGALLTRTRPGRSFLLRTAKVRVAPRWTNPASPEELIGSIRRPVAIVHGAADRFIPARQARRLADHAGGPCRVEIVTGMRHSFDQRALRHVLGAVDWTLAQA
jgi:pimeloyl-ACP methyl ester carboxylesterase